MHTHKQTQSHRKKHRDTKTDKKENEESFILVYERRLPQIVIYGHMQVY